MKRKSATRNALFTSIISLLLCVSMLVGTTFAWFTDSVTSGSNVITAGNLDIDVQYTLDGKNWADLNGAKDLFQKDLWEPGHTEVVVLKIENKGSLALKYVANMNIVQENIGKTKDGKDIVLSDILTVSTLVFDDAGVDPLFGFNIAEKTVEKAFEGENGIVYGAPVAFKNGNVISNEKTLLKTGDITYVAIKVDMAETIGNEANHDGKHVPSIEFGINVLATQYTKENDSFGPDYDAPAPLCHVIVSNEEELAEALANAENGYIIGISGNVTWTTGAGIGSTPFVTNAKHITLVGLDENSVFTATGKGVGAVGIDDGTVVFKNLKIADASVSYAENSWEYGYLEFRGNTVFENCEVVNAIMMEGASAKFVDCSFNSFDDNQYAVWVSDGTVSFENCYFAGARGLKIHEAYGSEVASVSVNNSIFANLTKKPGVAIGDVNAETAIALTNNLFANTQAGDQGNFKYETDTDVATFNFVDKDNKVTGEFAVQSPSELIDAVQKGEEEFIIVKDIATEKNTETLIEAPAGSALKVNGNGATITTNGTGTAAGSSYDYGYVGFIPAKGEDATVSDLKVVGSGFVEVGHHGNGGGNYTINKLVVEDLVATLNINNGGNNIAAAFSHYGNAVMTDCVMTGTTTLKDGFKPYDAAFVNGTKTTINGGEYGTIYLAHQAHVTISNAKVDVIDSCAITTRNLGELTISAGAEVRTINLTPGTYSPALVIEAGATVGAIVYNGVTYTQAEWMAR